MIIVTTPAEMQAWSRGKQRAGLRIGLVPTMGALHEGHLALIDRAREASDVVIVTIFVNPLQFERADDLVEYPRPMDDDLAQCCARGVDAVYCPGIDAMYPEGFQTTVAPGRLGTLLEGAHRPGHFQGVTTVVTKLFNATRPDVAVLGEKDYQQLAIIRHMTRDLDFGIEIIGVPTVREPDGLAMSSRNRRLTPDQRAAAVVVPHMLDAMVAAIERGVVVTSDLVAVAVDMAAAEPLARIDSVDIVDAVTLEPLDTVDGRTAVALVALWIDDIRLIDTRPL